MNSAPTLVSIPAPAFVHLRLHSEFSVNDGIVRIADAVRQAAADGQPALALTDANNLFGLIKFYRAARGKGVKPIAGCDVWITNDADRDKPYRMLLLVRNRSGYLQLCQLLTRAWLTNQYRGRPELRSDWFDEIGVDGLLALSGAQAGEIGVHLTNGNLDGARAAAQRLTAQFPQALYLEVQRYGQAGAEAQIQQTLALAVELQLPVVATHPVQFLQREDFRAHEARVCIADGEILTNPRRHKRFTEEQYFKSQQEMAALFADIPAALANTLEIAKRCNLTLELGKPQLPQFPTPEGVTLDDYLRQLAQEGLEKRLLQLFPHPQDRDSHRAEYEARLKIEADTIISMGFPGYFLIVADFINWGKNNGVPVGPGRGSGAGSLVAYALGITDLDPIRYDLLFERFLNPERVSMPDFDIDFCQDNRDKVIDYVKRRYGKEAVSQIATFGTLGAKAVIRDAGRVLDLPYNYCDSLSKLIPFSPTDPWDLERAMKEEPAFRERVETEEGAGELVALARPLEGLTRNVGMHAGGVLIAPGKLTDFCPLYCAQGTESVVSQYDKDDVEAIGLVKFDFLGLRNLTILDWAVRYVRRFNDDQKEFQLETLPLDDPAVYQLFGDGLTTAVFQSESRSAKDLEKKLKPDNFEDIIALMALNRPGPLGSGMVDDFIARKSEQRKTGVGKDTWYFHPKLKETLQSTYGVIVYQEQVMLVAQLLAGYTLGGADMLRRAMGKKKPEEMAQQREIFTTGAVERGVDKNLATQLFDLMEKFAEYGFNKSHSAAYALIAYQTGWLKAHYPAEFMAATLSSDMDDTDKMKIFVEDAISACKLKVLPPDINLSGYRFEPVRLGDEKRASGIRYGLGAVKGTGEAAVEQIVLARNADGPKGGPFRDIFDFCLRVDKRLVNRRAIEALVRSGAFDKINPDRAVMLATVGKAMDGAEQAQQSASQVSLFGEETGTDTPHEMVSVPAWDERRKLMEEKAALGFYLSGHLFHAYGKEVRRFAKNALSNLRAAREPQMLAGIIAATRTMMTKRGKMIFIVLDDGTAQVEVSVFNELYEQNRHLLKDDSLLILQGKVSEDSYTGGLRVVADKLMDLPAVRAQFAKVLRLSMNGISNAAHLKTLLAPYRVTAEQGACPVVIQFHNTDAQCEVKLGDDWLVRLDDKLLADLGAWLKVENVQLVYG